MPGPRNCGPRTWTASFFPAVAGITLPFWLNPPRFEFRWLPAVEFLIATVLVHAGFSLLHAGFETQKERRTRNRLLARGTGSIAAGCLVGLHINSGLVFHPGVPRTIFIVYGIMTLFAGLLYVAPPLRFWRRIGGELVLAAGLGMLPMVGAYLVMVGDITRKVYLASAPLVIATFLWVWIQELMTRADDERLEIVTAVVDFGPRFSGRVVAPLLSVAFAGSIVAAVLTHSVAPWSLVALLTLGLAWRVAMKCWKDFEGGPGLKSALSDVYYLHLATGVAITMSPLV